MSELTKEIFVVVNVLFSVIVVSICLVSWPGAFKPVYHNLKYQCKDPGLKATAAPQASHADVITMGISVLIIFIIISSLRNKYKLRNSNGMYRAVLWEVWVALLNFNLLYLLIEFIKCTVGMPVPYFFNDYDLQQSICLGNNDPAVIDSVQTKNRNLLKSFPSFRCAIWSFCSVFIYLYLGHWDVRGTFHFARQVFLIAMATACFAIYNGMYNNMEHYFDDICVGAVLGIVQAIVAIRDIFGSFFSSQSFSKDNTPAVTDSTPLQAIN